MSGNSWIRVGAVLGFLAVALGAFAAHGLRGRLTDERMLANFETAARYQMYHALALLAVGLLARSAPSATLNIAGWAFLAGILVFSGSLYLLVLTGQRWLGAITPIGGMAMLAGWLALALGVGRGSPG